jgi:hypothetical protein
MCLNSSEGCLAGMDFHAMFPKNDDTIVSVPLGPSHSKDAQLAICVGEDSGHYVGCAEHSCHTCPTLERVYLQIASDRGQQTPTLGQCSWVCEMRTVNQVAFYMQQSLLQTTALPIDRLHLEIGLHVNSFHGEIHRVSKETHTRARARTHTHMRAFSNSPMLHVD